MYDLGDGRVLRRYRVGIDAAAEAAVMEHVRERGFPAPRVHRAAGRDLVMEYVPGPTMLRALLDGDLTAPAAATVLAGLHERLHAIAPLRLSGRARSTTRPAAVVHLDLHPDNVVLMPTGAVLLDWTNATDGPAELDVAMSALILAQAAVGHRAELAGTARSVLEAFVRLVGPITMIRQAAERRGADPTQDDAEIELLARAVALVETLGG